MPLLTIDQIWRVLQRSVLHPFIAWLALICLHAVQTPKTSPKYYITTAYATILTLIHILLLISHRIAHGPPREISPDDEIVLITGASSGLGRCLAAIFSRKGLTVINLDITPPTNTGDEDENIHYYQCDVSNYTALSQIKERIEKEFGKITILINNAGIIHGTPLLTLSPSHFTTSIHVNLLSHFNTLSLFLPALTTSPHGGTVVTISSVLGKIGAAGLTDYAASKAGLIALHNSLQAEVRGLGGRVKMVLVTPGQLGTGLFAGVQTPSDFLGPVVEPVELAREVVRVVLSGDGGEISLPLYAGWIEWMFVLPAGVQVVLRRLSGVDRAMDGFEEKRKQKEK